MRGFSFLLFVFVTVAAWGVYGPVLHESQHSMAEIIDGQSKVARWKPFIGVGFAYFLIAVLFPIVVLFTKGEKGHWTLGGFLWAFFSGGVGAVGALGIILAFNFGGKPVFVMPLVFGCAPVINTVVTMMMSKTIKEASWFFYTGVLIVAIGAAGVMFLKPTEAKSEKEPAVAEQVEEGTGDSSESDKQIEEPGFLSKTKNGTLMLLSVGLTALCWGAYGPFLHKGQMKMGGSRLRPFLCVGLAYFVIAVLVPIPLLAGDPGSWTFSGSTWGLLAGTAGAVGALGIIYAFNSGGRPIFIMPLVFGLAPVVNTMSTTLVRGLWGNVTWPFLISLSLVILGSVTVLLTAPRPKPAPKQDAKPDQQGDESKTINETENAQLETEREPAGGSDGDSEMNSGGDSGSDSGGDSDGDSDGDTAT